MPQFRHEGFENLPVDDDTKTLTSKRVEIDGHGLVAIHESWSWEGTSGETLIFRETDLDGRSDEDLKQLVTDSGFLEAATAHTISRDREGFAFVNFNFRS